MRPPGVTELSIQTRRPAKWLVRNCEIQHTHTAAIRSRRQILAPATSMIQSYLGFRLILVALLIGLNGFFAAAEVALLSVRSSRLRQLAEEGQSGAQAALNLLANPARLLSVTQVGVTLSSLGLGWAGEETLFRIIQSLFHPDWGPAAASVIHGASLLLAFLGGDLVIAWRISRFSLQGRPPSPLCSTRNSPRCNRRYPWASNSRHRQRIY